jgi:pyruvate dehydrogenase E2 component (dihydrolipoamide acetyltransferase)
MAFDVVMPRLGWNMEQGALAGWRKKDGDTVAVGEIIFEVESDKAIQEVEAVDSGILRIPPDSPPLGKQVPVGTLLAYLLAPGESLPAAAGAATPRPAPEAAPTAAPIAAPPTPVPAAPPAAAARAGLPAGGKAAISPRARRVAAELGVEWTGIAGSGRTGRIVERDVRRASAARPAAPFIAGAAAAPSPWMDGERRGQGRPGAAPLPAAVTMTTEADATDLVQLLDLFRAGEGQPAPSFDDALVRIAAAALVEQPRLNARPNGQRSEGPGPVNIGFTVETDRGFVVPVIRDAANRSLLAIARESARLAEGARAGRLAAEDLDGGTFTVTDLGGFDIDTFTPAIRSREHAILGAGRIVAKQVVTQAGTVAIRRMVTLSLAFDHRRVDAAAAARFLSKVKHSLERPLLLIAGL